LAADSCRRWSVFGCVSVAIYASTSHGHWWEHISLHLGTTILISAQTVRYYNIFIICSVRIYFTTLWVGGIVDKHNGNKLLLHWSLTLRVLRYFIFLTTSHQWTSSLPFCPGPSQIHTCCTLPSPRALEFDSNRTCREREKAWTSASREN
jgi:hypothetical protein